ncbi:hypothetical protein ACIQWN_32630 [Streptomyces vinaceus]|uniref:hypothetical protein n=1 Tax=Streptomyces vinaceus TaxID=1960 RepID=UPI00380DC2BC
MTDPASLDLGTPRPKTSAYMAQRHRAWVPVFDAHLSAVAKAYPGRGFTEAWQLVTTFENRYPSLRHGINDFESLQKAVGELTSAHYIKNRIERRRESEKGAAYLQAVQTLDKEFLPVFRTMAQALRKYLAQDPSNHLKIMKSGTGDTPDLFYRRLRLKLAALSVASLSLRDVLDALTVLKGHAAFTELEAGDRFKTFSNKLKDASKAADDLDTSLFAYADDLKAARAYEQSGREWEAVDIAVGKCNSDSIALWSRAVEAFEEAANACASWAREKANQIHRNEKLNLFEHPTAGAVLQLADTVSDLALTVGAAQKYLGPVAVGFAALKTVKSGLRTVWQISQDWQVTVDYIVANVPTGIEVSFLGTDKEAGAKKPRKMVEGTIDKMGDAYSALRAASPDAVGHGLDNVSPHLPGQAVDGLVGPVAGFLNAAPSPSHLAQVPGVNIAVESVKAVKDMSRSRYDKVQVITDPDKAKTSMDVVRRCLGPLLRDDFDTLSSSLEILVEGENTLKVAFADLVTGERRVGWLDGFMNFQDEKEALGPMSLWVRQLAERADLEKTLHRKSPCDAEIDWSSLFFLDARRDGNRATFLYNCQVTFPRMIHYEGVSTTLAIDFEMGYYEQITLTVTDVLCEDRLSLLRLGSMELEALSMALTEIPEGKALAENSDRTFQFAKAHPLVVNPPSYVQGVEWATFQLMVADWNEWVQEGYVPDHI